MPKGNKQKKYPQLGFRASPQLIAALRKAAKSSPVEGQTVSGIIVETLTKKFL